MTIQSLRQKHTDRTRQSIIDAAFELFLEHGPSAVPPAVAARIARLREVSDHKRELPPIAPV